MERKIIQFPKTHDAATPDPVAERALFFAEYGLTEIMATIPQVDPDAVEAKFVY